MPSVDSTSSLNISLIDRLIDSEPARSKEATVTRTDYNVKNVKEARLGRSDNDTLKTVEEIKPDIILLGPDQKYNQDTLKRGLEEKGLKDIIVKRLNTYYDKYELHSSSLIKKRIIDEYKK